MAAPTLPTSIATLNVVLTAGTANAQVLIPAVAGQAIYLWGFIAELDTASTNGFHINDGNPATGGTELGNFTLTVVEVHTVNYGGARATSVGNALYVWSDSNTNIRGSMSYAQQ